MCSPLDTWVWCSALLLAVALLFAPPVHAAGHYDALFRLEIHPDSPVARGSLTIKQNSPLLLSMRLNMPENRYKLLKADGGSTRDGRYVLWNPAGSGVSRLEYEVELTQPRGRAYDALLTKDWALLRGDDVFPAAQTKEVDAAASRSRVDLRVPDGWKKVTSFKRQRDGSWTIDNPDRLFDRPTGWILVGRLGIKRETIAGLPITVAAPIGARAQRVTMLAMLRWNLGWMLEQTPAVPERLLIVSGADPLWRGGLSAQTSLFLHADLPLISNDGSSPLLHEVAHVLYPVNAAEEEDWIDEGVAEFIGLRAMRETGTLSQARYEDSIAYFRRRGDRVKSLLSADSRGAVTARAVALLHDLDEEMQLASNGRHDIMSLMRAMMESDEPLTLRALDSLVTREFEFSSQTLTRELKNSAE